VALINYGRAIRDGFEYLLMTYSDVFVIGQGLWSPWYVGQSMTDLDLQFGKSRIVDTPVSENACTGAAVGASLNGMRPIVVHPRMDFMMYSMDPIVNQAAKWSSMFGGAARPNITIRAIVNRGGEQGAQHSQMLHAWFAHIPGLRVVMPTTPADARDLLIASVLCPDPVIYIDDRWLYDIEAEVGQIREQSLASLGPHLSRSGSDITLVGSGYSAHQAEKVSYLLERHKIFCDVIDLRQVAPLDITKIRESVIRTGRLVVLDGGWASCGLSAEVIARVVESVEYPCLKSAPLRITLPAATAPCAATYEAIYYQTDQEILNKILQHLKLGSEE
jgi:pyruvate/2-oxoglutarate/acetoin dehydrogenase E1 component